MPDTNLLEPLMPETRTQTEIERQWLFSSLCSMGNYFTLETVCNSEKLREEIKAFDEHWKIYNPTKPNFGREGLSVTSLDGDFTGVPDLTSLTTYNRMHSTNYNEMSFRQLTPVFESSEEVRRLVGPFLPCLGRTHFLRFREGGFFPYHRDDTGLLAHTFRLFVALHAGSSRDFVFLLGDEKLRLEPGRVYFINTRIEHAVFSFEANSIHLVMNLELTRPAVNLIQSRLFSY